MNYDQIKNSEERIFPFYKGKYMGKTELGFSNRSSAQKFMNDIPDKDVYERFGGKEEYDRTHSFICGLDEYHFYSFNPAPGCDIYSKRQYDDIHRYDLNNKKYLKDLPKNDVKEIKRVVDSLGFLPDCNVPEKLEIIRDFIKKWNLFPEIVVDYDDFRKMHRKMMKEDIEYKRGIIHINIEYLD